MLNKTNFYPYISIKNSCILYIRMCRFADPKDCRYFFMCLRTGHPRRAGCGQGQVENRFYGLLAADMASNKSFLRRVSCG
jgi:hypothetical protein